MIDMRKIRAALVAVPHRYRTVFRDRQFIKMLSVGVLLFAVSIFANYAANVYTTIRPGTPVQDLILDRLPVVNMNDIYIEGFAVLLGCVTLLGLHRPHKIPFMLKTIAAFVGIRSFFIILTHLSVPVTPELYDQLYAPVGGFVKKLSAGNDLFFSAHTGLPFLMSLLFWDEFWLRMVFIAASTFFGSAVLLAHVHYSIDVFSAFFITFSIFHLSKKIFKQAHAVFLTDPAEALQSVEESATTPK